MLLLIHDNLALADLQERFNEAFPGLALRFYQHAHGYKKSSPPEEQLDPRTLVGAARRGSGKEGMLRILTTDTVRAVESNFRDAYGLHAQVVRLEPGCAVQTSATDKYTLGRQMELVEQFRRSSVPGSPDQIREYEAL